MSTRYDQPLTAAQMQDVLSAVMTGRMPSDQVKQFLTTLARRGETAEEITAAVEVLRTYAVRLPLAHPDRLCDTCGTGGDGQSTINVSTIAALVAAAAGVRIAKHGNRAASSQCGSADVLEALGVNLAASPTQVARCIDEVGFGFCFAPVFHPVMKQVALIRRELGIRTLFNLVGPLANPARLTYQVVGVSEARLVRPMAEALLRLGIRRGMVVHGSDGLDEVTTTGPSLICEVDGSLTEQQLDPQALGLARADLAMLRGGAAPVNAAYATEVLAGLPSPRRDMILLNAACAITVAGVAPDLAGGLARARDAIDRGRAAEVLERVKELTHAG